jgi:hypothetical protein
MVLSGSALEDALLAELFQGGPDRYPREGQQPAPACLAKKMERILSRVLGGVKRVHAGRQRASRRVAVVIARTVSLPRRRRPGAAAGCPREAAGRLAPADALAPRAGNAFLRATRRHGSGAVPIRASTAARMCAGRSDHASMTRPRSGSVGTAGTCWSTCGAVVSPEVVVAEGDSVAAGWSFCSLCPGSNPGRVADTSPCKQRTCRGFFFVPW